MQPTITPFLSFKNSARYLLTLLGFPVYVDYQGFPGGTRGEEAPASAGDVRDLGSIPGWGRSPGGGHGHPLQYSCLVNPVHRGAWQATGRGSQRVRHGCSD